MLIGELARATGSTARALRHYEQAGLIGSSRAANGYREYDESAAVRVRNIRALLAAGFTLEDVRPFLDCLDHDVLAAPPSAAALRIARERLAVLERRIEAQTAARDRLVAALAAAERARAGAGAGRALTGTAAPTAGTAPAGAGS
ncbi:MerR family transcriptional regulator [Kitasatospora sp. A2-31]|uniref:MerR family transcriptional regulator n=1 Tax=Kitasatospora sp. A2-31 TaxID=2916414 RepID=UPI001EE7E82A|nr:MerR family transcriptional regulator [Kitasatospora sp. A2-31]MCG6492925.1 MerR family transcriptional regulator [Kitasatospora sp. A2-31]